MKKIDPGHHAPEKSNADWYFNTSLHFECLNCRDRLLHSEKKVVRGMKMCPLCGHALFWKRLSTREITERKKQFQQRIARQRRQELAKIASDNGFYKKLGGLK